MKARISAPGGASAWISPDGTDRAAFTIKRGEQIEISGIHSNYYIVNVPVYIKRSVVSIDRQDNYSPTKVPYHSTPLHERPTDASNQCIKMMVEYLGLPYKEEASRWRTPAEVETALTNLGVGCRRGYSRFPAPPFISEIFPWYLTPKSTENMKRVRRKGYVVVLSVEDRYVVCHDPYYEDMQTRGSFRRVLLMDFLRAHTGESIWLKATEEEELIKSLQAELLSSGKTP